MTHYTLFIDESGEFGAGNRRDSWIVGGLLISMPFNDFEKYIENVGTSVQKKYGIDKSTDFHATEIRDPSDKKTHQKVRNIFADLVQGLNRLVNTKYYLMTTINQSNLESYIPEKTYRLMLLDLIIQCEKIIENNGDYLASFDLVVASRQGWTNEAHIKNEIESLASAIESNLVAYGRLYFLNDKLKIYSRNAKNFWGLRYADFLCNISQHRKFPENNEFLLQFEAEGKLYNFQTFDSVEIRRIQSYEVNQNYSSAIFDCLRLLEHHNTEEVVNLLIRILKTAIIDSGTTGVKVNFDAILEKIWRDKIYYDDFNKKAKILLKLSEQLNNLNVIKKIKNLDKFQFQLRNLVLLCYNHTANTDLAEKIVAEQEQLITKLIADPSNFSMILDYYVRAIEIYVNSLAYEEAQNHALKYKKMINDYFLSWQILHNDINEDEFLSSSVAIRADSALIRTQILNFDDSKEVGTKILKNIESTLKIADTWQDRSRLQSQKLVLLCKMNNCDEAVRLGIKYFESAKSQGIDIGFEYFFLLYVVNQKLLLKEDEELIREIESIINEQYSYKINFKKYPTPIIYRELSLFNHLINNKKEAVSNLKLSNESLVNILSYDSETTRFLKLLNYAQETFMDNSKLNLVGKAKSLKLKSNLNQICIGKDKLEILMNLRKYVTS